MYKWCARVVEGGDGRFSGSISVLHPDPLFHVRGKAVGRRSGEELALASLQSLAPHQHSQVFFLMEELGIHRKLLIEGKLTLAPDI